MTLSSSELGLSCFACADCSHRNVDTAPYPTGTNMIRNCFPWSDEDGALACHKCSKHGHACSCDYDRYSLLHSLAVIENVPKATQGGK